MQPTHTTVVKPGRSPTEIVILGRLSYVTVKGRNNLVEQRPQIDSRGTIIGEKGGWGASLLLTPNFDKAPFMAAAIAVMETVHGADRGKWPSRHNYRTPMGPEKDNIIRPVDVSKNPDFEGWYNMPFATYGEPPVIVGPRLERIMNKDEIYSGRWANIAINLYWIKQQANTTKTIGLSAGLQSIQLMWDDERIGGGVSAPEAYFQQETVADAAGITGAGIWGDDIEESPF